MANKAVGKSTPGNRRCGAERPAAAANWLLFCCLLSAAGGCSSDATFEFDELDVVPVQEELTEFSLGQFRIPIPLVDYDAANQPRLRNRYQLEFELFALISPDSHSRIAAALQQHEGKIRDRVIRICRNASFDELQETELATLKARLMDSLAPQIGQKDVRQLLITEIVSHEIGIETTAAQAKPAHGGGH